MTRAKLRMTRRSFLKAAAVVGAATALSSATSAPALAETDAPAPAGDVKRIRTACRGCGKMECGVWVTVENGRAVKIEGDESAFHAMGNCCTKSQASLQVAYHPDRLRYPMKRTTPRGEDPGWQRITWDEAYDLAYKSMMELYEKQGGSAFFVMGGTSRFWGLSGSSVGSLVGALNSHGANQICKGPRRLVGSYTTENAHHFMATDDHPKVYLQWGSEQTQSNYDDSCRTVTDVVHDAECYISVDPRKHNLGKSADYHLALRPGSDSALAMAWLNIILSEQLYDELLCKRWTNAPYLVCEEKEPQAWEGAAKFSNLKGNIPVRTQLLQECDLKEDGKISRFMVWDAKNDRLTYFDADPAVANWEGADHWNIPTTGWEFERGGWVPDPSGFEVDIDPALWGEYEVTLKDGRTVVCKTVFQKWWDDAVSKCSVEDMAPLCDLDPQLIYDACHAYCDRIDPRVGNGGVNYQLAPEQCGNNAHTLRALALISCITGNYDIPGGNRGFTRAGVKGCGGFSAPYSKELNAKVQKPTEPKAQGNDFPLWRYGADASSIWRTILSSEPYPIKSAIIWSGDFMNQSNTLVAWEALNKLEFILEANLWHHPGGDLADVLLPVEHWLEIPGFARISQGAGGAYGANCNCIDPIGDVKFDCEIILDLYRKWDIAFFDPADPEGDAWSPLTKYFDYQVKDTGMTWEEYYEEFQKNGWWDAKKELPDQWGTYRRYEMGTLRTMDGTQYTGPGDGVPGTVQPTMKIDVWSTIIESVVKNIGRDDAPVLPEYAEPVVSPYRTPEKFEHLGEVITTDSGDAAMVMNATSGRRIPVYFHSEHRQLPWCRELWPAPRCEINPEDAAKLGIEQGDWMWIENENGKIRQTADLYYGIKPGVINMEHQWWFPELDQVGHGFELCGCNCLVYMEGQDPWMGSSQLRAYDVKVYKATPENSPFNNPVPCGVDGTEIIHSASDPRLKEWKGGIDAIAQNTARREEYAK